MQEINSIYLDVKLWGLEDLKNNLISHNSEIGAYFARKNILFLNDLLVLWNLFDSSLNLLLFKT